ncbi:MAG: hypothetical protein ACREHC_01845 [Candidatus Levyibacteriota bacterium]
MRNLYRTLFLNTWTIYIIIPLVLFLLGAVMTLFLVSPLSFSTLTYQQKPEVILQPTDNVLLKDDHFVETITAQENDLGIIALHFSNTNTVEYDDEDKIAFQLTDISSNKVIYKNTYRSGLLISSKYFPFGFPKVADSKGRQYEVTITSLKGNPNNALHIDTANLTNQVSYDYGKHDILGSPSKLISFLAKKYVLIFTDNQTLFITFEYFMPFLFYCIFLSFNRRGKANPYISEVLLFFIMLYDIFFIVKLYSLVLIGILIVWLIFVKRHRLESSVSYLFAFIFFIISILMQSLQFIAIANKASVWGYFLIVIGTVQLFREIYTKGKNTVPLREFIRQLR